MGNKNCFDSSILFAPPSIVKGIARCGDVYGQLDEYNTSQTEAEADAKAIYYDWVVIGYDFMFSMSSVKKEIESQINTPHVQSKT